MTGEFSTWLAVAVQGPTLRALPPEELAAVIARAAKHDSIDECDADLQAMLRQGWAASMAGESLTFRPPLEGGDWEAEDEAVGVQMKAMYGEDVQWAGL